MNKKESDRLKAAARKQYQLQQSMLEVATSSSSKTPCYDVDCSRYYVWGTAILLVMIFVIL